MGLVARQVEDRQAIQSILCCASITTHIPLISSGAGLGLGRFAKSL